MKYQFLYEAIQQQIQRDPDWRRTIRQYQPRPLTLNEVKQCHCPEYVDALSSGELPLQKMRRIGFPWSEKLIERTLLSAGGTVLTALHALQQGKAIHLSGGYHHAHHDFGSGFCLFNDLVLAATFGLKEEGIDKVLIVDSDVHHGDGTATLCADNPDIISLSFHCEKNFPARKPSSDLDVPLPRDAGDEEFLSTFKNVVPLALNLHQPDLVIYDAGIDIHCDDELGYLDISTEAIFERDRFMFDLMQQRDIPIAAVVGGGYRSNNEDLVPIHMQLIRAALAVS